MSGLSYGALIQGALAELVVLGAALAVLGADLVALREAGRRVRWLVGGLVAAAGCVAAGISLWLFGGSEAGAGAVTGWAGDALTAWVKGVVLILTLLTVGLSVAGARTEHVGEYLAMVLLGAVGMLVLAGAEDLLLVFLGLELTSLTLYVLVGFEKERPAAVEAALKYFLFGSVAAAFTLFGMSLLYGLTGTVQLRSMGEALGGTSNAAAVWVALVMVLVGLGFKVAAAPFHLWAPDAYEAAPTPSAALVASGSKVASFYALAKLLMVGWPEGGGGAVPGQWVAGWGTVLAALSVVSMVWGNVAALVQGNVRRLLAYSAVAHAGYALLAVMANTRMGLASLLYFVATYGLSAVGAFGVVSLVESQRRGSVRLEDFAGLSRRSPEVAVCLAVYLLSLAGIPPLAGFFGKFYVFVAALGSGVRLGLLWLVAVAILLSTVSLYYYLQVLKQAWVRPPGDGPMERWRLPWEVRVSLWATTAGVVGLGVFPSVVLRGLERALQASGF
ncbi:NADH-quinone oxidoreductase subunit N [Limisphaera sp. VF-2]|jgi:NADH-quinone oxidoreductase subunit N|uniref:NADH-quinone oxidoreductase subunit N n=1 Tax=Limisphaera sp. VF-2 TaxID=3400418 RepID=UPI001755060A